MPGVDDYDESLDSRRKYEKTHRDMMWAPHNPSVTNNKVIPRPRQVAATARERAYSPSRHQIKDSSFPVRSSKSTSHTINNSSSLPVSHYSSNHSSPARQRRRDGMVIKPHENIEKTQTPPSVIPSSSSHTTTTGTSRHHHNHPSSSRTYHSRSQSVPSARNLHNPTNTHSPNALAESTVRHHKLDLWMTERETLVNPTTNMAAVRHIESPPSPLHKETIINVSSSRPRQSYNSKPIDHLSYSLTTQASISGNNKLPSSSPPSSSPVHSPPTSTTNTTSPLYDGSTTNYLLKSHNSTDIHRRSQSFDSSTGGGLTGHLPPIGKTSNIKTGSPLVSSSLSSTTGCGLVGLYNSGNTCYMNSVLQCLSLTVALTEYFLSGKAKTDKPTGACKRTPVTDAYGNFLEQKGRADKAITPSNLRSVMSSRVLMVRTTEQQDAQEFLLYLLCCIHEEMNIPTGRLSSYSCTNLDSDSINEKAAVVWRESLAFDNSFLSKLFMGQIRSTLTCLTCNNVVINFETFWSLSLPLPRTKSKYYSVSSCASISECFRLYATEERLDHDNKPICTRCKSPQASTKKLSVQVFPNILILHLKRFTVQSRFSTKLSTNIIVPSILTVEEIAADKELVKSFHYELYGVINHSGSISFGHYKADCKHKGKWYCFNDRIVTPSSEASVTSPSQMPYVLFYERKPNHS